MKAIEIMAQDIRVGNKLLYFTSEKEWVETVLDWQDLKWIETDTKGFNAVHEPIPITPEILTRAGLTKTEFDSNVWDVCEVGRRTVFVEFVRSKIFILFGIAEIQAQGFHHLQNILRDLTGKELMYRTF